MELRLPALELLRLLDFFRVLTPLRAGFRALYYGFSGLGEQRESIKLHGYVCRGFGSKSFGKLLQVSEEKN